MSGFEPHQGRAAAPAVLGRVGDRGHERMFREQRPNDLPLNPDAAPVDQPDLRVAARVCRAHVLVDDGRYVTRDERVQIEGGLDWNLDQDDIRLV